MIAAMPVNKAAKNDWDAIVIGAGPAGALAAYLLAGQSLCTLLIEKQVFPRYKVCGGCLNSKSLRILDESGLGQLVDMAHANHNDSLRLFASGETATIKMPPGRSVSRQRFDAALVGHAIEAGVEFCDGTQALVLPIDKPRGGRKVSIQNESGQTNLVTAKIVLVADGLAHPSLRRLPEFRVFISSRSYVGLGMSTSSADQRIARNAITMALGRRGYIGSVLVEDSTINMAAAVCAKTVKAIGAEAAIASILADAGCHDIATPAGKWIGTRSLTCRSSRVAGERLFVIGDATGYVEPFTGEGMAWALASGQAVVPFAKQACMDWTPQLIKTWSKRQHNVVGDQRICRCVTQFLRYPFVSKSAVKILSRYPWVASPFVSGINRTITESVARKRKVPN